MGFAHTLISAGVSQRIGLVPTGVGGTSLYEDWNPTYAQLYTRMITATTNAMTSAIATWGSANVRLRGMLWVQGESDAAPNAPDVGPSHTMYGSNFQAFLNKARTDLAQFNPNLPCIMAVMSDINRVNTYPYIGTVRQQQQNLVMSNLLKVDQVRHCLPPPPHVAPLPLEGGPPPDTFPSPSSLPYAHHPPFLPPSCPAPSATPPLPS